MNGKSSDRGNALTPHPGPEARLPQGVRSMASVVVRKSDQMVMHMTRETADSLGAAALRAFGVTAIL